MSGEIVQVGGRYDGFDGMFPNLHLTDDSRPVSENSANLSLVRRRWPEVWKCLQESPIPKDWSVSQDTPEPTLLVQGLQLTSAYNRLREAQLQAGRIPPTCPEVYVYGMAFGDLVQVLLEKQTLRKITVVSLHPGIDRLLLLLCEESDWLRNPRVEFVMGSMEKNIHRPFVVAPAYLRLASPDSLKLRDQLILELNQPYQRQYFEGLEELYHQRLEENRSRVASDGDIRTLFGSKPQGDFVVAAAGPTLEDSMEWLRSRRTGLNLVTVTHALKPLLEAGIVPDIALAIDHSHLLLLHLEGLNIAALADITLGYAPVVHPDLLRRWSGPKLVFYLDDPHYNSLSKQLPKGYLFSSGTVVHTAVDLCVRMGAQQITMLGTDFSYPAGKTHVPGAAYAGTLPEEQQHHFTVCNGYGCSVSTDINFLGYIRDLELYISKHPEVRFFKRGKAGVMMQGVGWVEE